MSDKGPMSEQSETPRTDALISEISQMRGLATAYTRMIDLSRSLERELSELRHKRNVLQKICAERADELSEVIRERDASKLCQLWLSSHCRAIGMTKKSDSGDWHHDVALFTIEQKDRAVAAERELEEMRGKLERVLIVDVKLEPEPQLRS